MRIGIISDVHGNLEALEAILKALDGLCIDKYVCLGDVVGYGAQPNECCEIVRDLVSLAVLGNHDAAVIQRMDYSYYYAAARQALDWCRGQLSEDNLKWLSALSYKAADPDIDEASYTHGSPLEPKDFGYVFALEQARELFSVKDQLGKVNFIGHSHMCKSFEFSSQDVFDIAADSFEIDPLATYIITVGSVGQPRDYDNRACAGVFDTDRRLFEYVRAEYDIETAAKKIFEANLAINFGKRLFLGV